ncbi:MAG: hypothetical protein WA446_18370 [Steroidobacteraceae bacterium]
MALRAASTFAKIDPVGLSRRLISIACEDVGAADIETVIETIAVATSPAWRSQHNDNAILAGVVRRRAEAPKDRSADLAMLAVRHHETLASRREICRQASLECRLQSITDPHASFLDGAVAAWFSSGLDFRWEHVVGPGNLNLLEEAYRAADVPDELAAAAIMAGRRTREPFTILLPLVWLEIQRSGGGVVCDVPIPETPVLNGLMLCAIDEHTRNGQLAIGRLVAEDVRLRRCLGRYVPKPRWTKAAQHAAFYADGAPITPRLEWAQSQSLETLGIEADLGSAQVPREGVRPLLEGMRPCLDRLAAGLRQVEPLTTAWAPRPEGKFLAWTLIGSLNLR